MDEALIKEAIILLLCKGYKYEDVEYNIAQHTKRPLQEIKEILQSVVSTGSNFVMNY
jgi:predicted transcriptional regulator